MHGVPKTRLIEGSDDSMAHHSETHNVLVEMAPQLRFLPFRQTQSLPPKRLKLFVGQIFGAPSSLV